MSFPDALSLQLCGLYVVTCYGMLVTAETSGRIEQTPHIRRLHYKQYTFSSPASYSSPSSTSVITYSSPSSSFGQLSFSTAPPANSYDTSNRPSTNNGQLVSGVATSYGSSSNSALNNAPPGFQVSAYSFGSPSAAFSAPISTGGSTSVSSYGSSSTYGNGGYSSQPDSSSLLISTLYGSGSQTGQLQAPALTAGYGSLGSQSAQLQSQTGTAPSSGFNVNYNPATVLQPNCAQASYNISIPDTTAINVTVLRVNAVDPQRLPLTFQITDPVFGAFDINPNTGDIFVNSNLVNFATAIEFTVHATNSQNQYCTSTVRINFIPTSAALIASPVVAQSAYNSGYGQPAASLTASPNPSPITYNSFSYGQSSSVLAAATTAAPVQPASYGFGYSQPAASLTAPAPVSSYGQSSSALIAAPSSIYPVSSYNQPAASLIASPAPPSYTSPASTANLMSGSTGSGSYGYGQISSSPLTATPSPSPASSYGQPTAPLIASPAPFGYSSPVPAANLVSGSLGTGSNGYGQPYGQSSGSLTAAAPSPSTSYGAPPAINYDSFSSPSGQQPSSQSTSYVGGSAGSLTSSATGYSSPATSGNLLSGSIGTGGYGGTSSALTANIQTFTCSMSPSGQLIRTDSNSRSVSSTVGFGVQGSDSVPTAPSSNTATSTINWSFFISSYVGSATNVGNLNTFGDGSSFTLNGNQFFVINPTTGDISLTGGFCPPASPSQQTLSVSANSPSLGTVRGNVSVVIFLSTSYLKACQSGQSTSAPSPTAAPLIPTGPPSPTPLATIRDASSATFLGDSSFTVSQCDSQPSNGIPQIAAFIRVRLTPNVDLSQLRITLSNSLFRPALPVVCDQSFICNITIVFSEPIDNTFQGSYLIAVNLVGGGLTQSSTRLQILLQCNDPTTNALPVPPNPRRGFVDPSMIVPELPPCGTPSISADVSEDVPVGTSVATLPTNSNPGFSYQIADASASGYFDLVDPGVVTVSSPLFEPTMDSEFLRVIGSVGNNSVCGIDVYIGIKNVNRNKPKFDQSSYNFVIDCTLPMDSVGTITATDIDAGRNNIRRFFLNPEDTPIASVQPASGIIRLRKPINESTTFTVFVENPGTTLRSSAQVQVSCTGMNSIFGSRSADRLFKTSTSTTTAPRLRMQIHHRPIATSNKPVSFPLTVIMQQESNRRGTQRSTQPNRPSI